MASYIRSQKPVITLVVAAAAVLFAGCKVTGDIGYPCALVRATDGGTVAITEGELPIDRDVISFGALECEDFVCIRARFTPRTGNDSAQAMGTCSQRGCSPTDPQACQGISPQADLTAGPFTCRPLLLDEETLAAICSSDPDMCEAIFGGQTSPYFCAQGADAGT